MTEFEQRKFRPEERTGRPYKGNVSTEPFPQALYKLALSRGYESQVALARALGRKKTSSAVNNWYTGGILPRPENLGQIIILLQPNDEELDCIVDSYADLLQKKRARRRGAYTERAIKIAQVNIKQGPSNIYELIKLCSKFKGLFKDELIESFLPFHGGL